MLASTNPSVRRARGAARLALNELGNDDMSPLFTAVTEATEEAVYNSLFMATTITGNGNRVEAIPLDAVRNILARYRPKP